MEGRRGLGNLRKFTHTLNDSHIGTGVKCPSAASAIEKSIRSRGFELLSAGLRCCMHRMRFVLLGSGKGSNAEAVLKAYAGDDLGAAEPVAIFSDKPEARILSLGERFGIPATYIDPGPKRTVLSPEAEERTINAISATKPDLVVLAGFMRVIKPPFLQAFPNRIINLHPSLLPAFKGLDAIGQAFAYGVKITGCTVHYVTEAVDGGPIIDQRAVRIEAGDDVATLAAKVHAAEHALLPAVIRQLADEFSLSLNT